MMKYIVKYKAIFLSAGMWGLFTHGMALFNKYSYHDDAVLFSIGAPYSSGRWMLGILDEWIKKSTGSFHYSMPLFNGVLTIVFIALACMLISDLFEIESRVLQAALTGIMVTFPVVTGLFGYIYSTALLFGYFYGNRGYWYVCRRTTMKMWCGFDPETADSTTYEQLPEVVQMPNYPDAGAIRVIDGVVVIKF